VRVVLVLALVLGGCAGSRTPSRPDEACALTCREKIPRCGETECVRGCALALDRLVEGQGDVVLGCVERSPAACDDWLWAECAARIGPHLDGGPSPPVPGPRR
jgi:hypothetical protein